MLLKKIIIFLKILINAKYIFKFPKKKKILLFDDNLEFFLNRCIPKSKYSVLFSRNKNYNLLLILKLLCKFKFSYLNYFNEYIKYVNPKILLTFSDNYPIFYKLKVPKKTKKIFAQAAYRTATKEDVFFNLKKLKKIKKINKVDEMLVFNKKIGEKYQQFINGNFRVIGSIKSNTFKIDFKKKKFDILYISSWRDRPLDWKLTESIYWKKIIATEQKLLEHIKKYAEINRRKVTVYGKYKSNKERDYFDNIFNGSNWTFLKNDRLKSYQICDKSKLIISTVSTLGYEALARGLKVIVFNSLSFNNSTVSKNFCWPYKMSKNGPFWTNNISQKSCNTIINYVSKLNSQNWIKVRDKAIGQTLKYDKGNKTLRKLLAKYAR